MDKIYRRDRKYNMSWMDSMFHTKKTKKEPTIRRTYPVTPEEAYPSQSNPGVNYGRFNIYFERDWQQGLGILDQVANIMNNKPKEEIKEKEYKETISNTVGCYLTYDKSEYWNICTKSQGHIADIYRGPTWNCQIQSIAGMNVILENYNTQQAIEILAHSWNNSNRKTELLLDIPQKDCDSLKLIFNTPTDILVEAPYINNTGTPMCIFVLQIKTMLDRNSMIVPESQFNKELNRYIYV